MPSPRTAPGLPSAPARGRAASLEYIRVLVDSLSRSARTIETRTGVTNAQLFLLQQLAESDGLSVNELADRARTHQSTASIVIARLVRARLVRKERAHDDGRRVVVALTPAGRRLLRHAPAPPLATLLRGLEALPAQDVSALERGLRALIRKLGLQDHTAALLFEPAAPGRSRSAGPRRTTIKRA